MRRTRRGRRSDRGGGVLETRGGMATVVETARPDGSTGKPVLVATIMMIAALMDMIDVTIVNVALPTIRGDLGAIGSDLQWVVSVYMLGFAATLIIAGRLGDLWGRRSMFLTGVTVFGAASLACSLAQQPWQLVAARAVQGTAAAVMMPQVLATFRTLFTGKARGTVFGVYGAVAGMATALGLLAGGLLVNADIAGLGWRPVFLVNIPVVIVVLGVAVAVVPATRGDDRSRPDILGSLVLATGLVAIVFPLLEGGRLGWPLWGWVCVAAGVVAVASLTVFGARAARRGVQPLLPTDLLRVRAFSTGLLIMLVFGVGLQGFGLVLALWLQAGQGYRPLDAGVTTIAFSVGSFLTAGIANGLARRIGRAVLVSGGLLLAVGIVGVDIAAHHAGQRINAWQLVPGLVIAGAGLGLLVVPLANVVLAAIPAEAAGGASGIFSTAQQLGGLGRGHHRHRLLRPRRARRDDRGVLGQHAVGRWCLCAVWRAQLDPAPHRGDQRARITQESARLRAARRRRRTRSLHDQIPH